MLIVTQHSRNFYCFKAVIIWSLPKLLNWKIFFTLIIQPIKRPDLGYYREPPCYCMERNVQRPVSNGNDKKPPENDAVWHQRRLAVYVRLICMWLACNRTDKLHAWVKNFRNSIDIFWSIYSFFFQVLRHCVHSVFLSFQFACGFTRHSCSTSRFSLVIFNCTHIFNFG